VKIYVRVALLFLAGVRVHGTLADDPEFKYRCAERAFGQADYAVAQKFYGEIVSDSPKLQLVAMCGLLDSMLCLGQWIAAERCVNAINFNQFEGVDGCDDLALRMCFVLIRNRRFAGAANILGKIDCAHLRDSMRSWHHLLSAMILRDGRKFEDADSEFELAKMYAKSDEQLYAIDLLKLQNIVSEIGTEANLDAIESSLATQMLTCENSLHLLDIAKLYALFLCNTGRQNAAIDLLEKVLQCTECKEDKYEMRVYHAIASGVLSTAGLADIKCALLGDCSTETKLLALKLLASSVRTDTDAISAANFLETVFSDVSSDAIRRSILLAKIAIFLNVERLDLCSSAASAYVKLFSPDKFFGDIYELLAYIALGGEISEYRNSAHYLDKLRASAADGGMRTAITLKMADTFFYNRDFKLASDMYGEVLQFNAVGKCGHALINQVLSDIALNNLEQAATHIHAANGEIYEKLDAIVEYLSALKRRRMCDEALRYIDSLGIGNLTHLTRYKFATLKAEFLLKNKQYAQALMLSSKICDELLPKLNAREYAEIHGLALFIKGCAAYQLKDCQTAGEAFKLLRSNFRDARYSALSFFREAKFLQKSGDIAGAILALESCQDAAYFPYVHYRVALLKVDAGLFAEANALLERIICDYPGSDVAVAARITQGDILRMAGDFANAQLVYEHASKFISNVRNANYLSLALAKCLIAQKNRNSHNMDSAADILENLCASPGQSVSFRLECAAEYCLALKLQNKGKQLRHFAFDILTSVDNSELQLTKKSRYWLVQILFILRNLADNSHGNMERVEYFFNKYGANVND
jgi:predicted negative regulator of RcsB-dependent stress response